MAWIWLLVGSHFGMAMIGILHNANLAILMMVPLMICKGSLITFSKPVMGFNICACLIEAFISLIKLTWDEREVGSKHNYSQISAFRNATIICLCESLWLCYAHKKMDSSIQNALQANYEKMEAISKQLIHHFKDKEIFMWTFSHQVRNCLNILYANVDYSLSLAPSSNKALKDILKNIKAAADRVLNMVTNLIDFSKLSSSTKLETFLIATDPITALRKVLITTEHMMNKKGIICQAFVHKKLPNYLLTFDSNRLIQILLNLLLHTIDQAPINSRIYIFMAWIVSESNNKSSQKILLDLFDESKSIIYLSPSSLSDVVSDVQADETRSFISPTETNDDIHQIPKILKNPKKTLAHVTAVHESLGNNFRVLDLSFTPKTDPPAAVENLKGYLKFQISEGGNTMSDEALHRLLVEFNLVESKRFEKNSVLGLWTSRNVLKQLGGGMDLVGHTNEKISGSSFVCYSPAVYTVLAATNTHKRASLQLQSHHVRVLVVDDDQYNRELHKFLLERENAEVILAIDGKDALEKFMNVPEYFFDCILMDINMPIMDGVTSMKEIRKFEVISQREKMVDIAFVTGDYSFPELIDPVSTGKISLFTKPIDVGMIKKLVQTYSAEKASVM